ncbi:hypothetical protein ACHAQA_003587 [Verticillium albo-atrum]
MRFQSLSVASLLAPSLRLGLLATVAAADDDSKQTIWATPHEQYSSSVGVLGCKIETNRVAYWPAAISCSDICVEVYHEDRKVKLLRIDRSEGAYDMSYDAWNYLYTGKSARDEPAVGGPVEMQYRNLSASDCSDLIHTDDSRLPLSAPNSMNYLASCLDGPDNWVKDNYVLYNVLDPICTVGRDEECELDWPAANQAVCPHTMGEPVELKDRPVHNVQYGTGDLVLASTGEKVNGGTGARALLPGPAVLGALLGVSSLTLSLNCLLLVVSSLDHILVDFLGTSPKRMDFEKQSYWRARFASEQAFEWLVSSSDLMAVLDPVLESLGLAPAATTVAPRVLQLGFGTSDLQNHFRSRGYDVTNLDYEPLACERGRALEAAAFGDVRMEYRVADVTQLPDDLGLFDLVVDKSTVDAVSCGGDEAFRRMVDGVEKCLSPQGVWVSLTYSADRFGVEGLPLAVEVLHKFPVPKLKPSEPDVFHWCYLLRPRKDTGQQAGSRTEMEQTSLAGQEGVCSSEFRHEREYQNTMERTTVS